MKADVSTAAMGFEVVHIPECREEGSEEGVSCEELCL